MSSSEIELIRQYFSKTLINNSHVKCGIGDDAAVVDLPSGMELVLSIDTLIAGVHFTEETDPEDVGYKSLAVSLSDIAAMGAEPRWVMMSLTLPTADQAWIEKYTKGFFCLARDHSVELIGGDLSRGPLSITVQINGLIPKGSAIKRSGACPDDLIYISGTLGDAGLALKMTNGELTVSEGISNYVINRLNRPVPRVALGLSLRNIATSAIDISDGLITDLGHILDLSKAGAILNPELLPLSEAFNSIATEDAWQIALTSGDDYELCFTIPASKKNMVGKLGLNDCPLTCVGYITPEPGMLWQKPDGKIFKPTGSGYQHF